MDINLLKKITLLIITMIMLTGCGMDTNAAKNAVNDGNYIKKSEMIKNTYESLCVPTQLTKCGDDYFIVDCYHNQILISKDVGAPIDEWKVMSDEINMGHSIASDGVVYLCDDTENNRILIYIKDEEQFYLSQLIEGVGKRPHYVQYNKKNKSFYVLSSLTGEFYIYKRKEESTEVYLERSVQIPQLSDVYVRSFSFIDGLIYMPAGNSFIYVIDPDSFEILSFQALGPELGGPTQICKIEDYYYLTVSTDVFANTAFANLVRSKDIADFAEAKYEVLKDRFCDDGTPYVITPVDDKYYLAWHSEDGKNCMWSFRVDKDNEISEIKRAFE